MNYRNLGKHFPIGVDANQNGTVEPVKGECGAEQAYEYGTYMADFSHFRRAEQNTTYRRK